MTKRELMVLEARIGLELHNISRLTGELRANAGDVGPHTSSFRLRAVGSVLHDFYTGVEKIWELIARTVDGTVPSGDEWHKELLTQMNVEVPGLRPAVIDKRLRDLLGEYLRFRHVFRNIYGFELDWGKMQELVEKLPGAVETLQISVRGFVGSLKDIAEEAGDSG